MREIAFLVVSFGWFGRSVESVDFDKVKPGAAPLSWTFPNTAANEPGRWMVHPDITAPSKPNVLAQLTAGKHRAYTAIALFDNGRCMDGDLSVELKMVSGKLEQTAGLIWRYQDAKNYYVVYIDAIADKITVHKVIDGRSTPVGSGQLSSATRRIDPQEWNVVKIVFRDQRTNVFFNHRKLIELTDDSINRAGKTGVWTKGDTIAYFDDFRIDKKKE